MSPSGCKNTIMHGRVKTWPLSLGQLGVNTSSEGAEGRFKYVLLEKQSFKLKSKPLSIEL